MFGLLLEGQLEKGEVIIEMHGATQLAHMSQDAIHGRSDSPSPAPGASDAVRQVPDTPALKMKSRAPSIKLGNVEAWKRHPGPSPSWSLGW